jgi:hypothetical protein
MDEMLGLLKCKMRKEILYSRSYQIMHRERYLERLSDMERARTRGDAKRQREIAQDLKAFTGEMWNLMEAQRSTFRRILGMRAGHEQSPAIRADTATPEREARGRLIRLVLPRSGSE